jgi:hypothetical protein
VRHEINIVLGKKVRRVTSGYLVPPITLQSHILSALGGIMDVVTIHIVVQKELGLKVYEVKKNEIH